MTTTDFCPKCGQQIEADSVFCRKCGTQLTRSQMGHLTATPSTPPRSGFVTVSGILSIVASCAAFLGAIILGVMLAVQPLIAVLVFAFGLTGGILAIKRSHFEIVIFGFALLFAESTGLLTIPYENLVVSFLGGSVLIMSIIGIVLSGIRESEFR